MDISNYSESVNYLNYTLNYVMMYKRNDFSH